MTVRIPLVLIFAAGVSVPAAAEQIAPGQPIDQVDCTNARQIVERMRRGLPAQEDALRRTQMQLDALQDESRRLDRAAQQILRDAARKEVTNVAKDFVKSLDTIKKAAEQLKRETGSSAAIDSLIDMVAGLETPAELVASADNATASTEILKQRSKSLYESIAKLNQFLVSSGTADKLFDELVGKLQLANPTAALLARGSRVMLDFVVTSEDSFDRAVEAQQAAHTVNLLQDQLNRVNDRIDLLTTRCLTPQTRGNNNTNGNSSGSAPKSGIGTGTIVTVAGAAVGGIVGWKYYKDTMAESEALLREFGNIPTPSSSPVQNTTPTAPAPPTGVRAFDGTYDFIVTTTGPGGTQTDRRLTQYLRINNGSLTGSDGSLNGTVTSSGTVTAVGACPINNDPADWTGTMLANGTGSGTYRCRTGGISRGWRADNRR